MRRLVPLVLVALAACSRTASYDGPADAPKVHLVGDSLVVESEEELRALFAGDRLAWHAERGEDTAWAAERVRRQVEGDPPDVAIVATGTNDWIEGWRPRDQEALDSVLRSLRQVPCAIWVLPAERFAEVGRRIAAAAEAVPNVHLARWDAHAAGHPEWYAEDGVHHNAAGERAYAEFIHGARTELC